jgi:hypothetical protein
MKIVHLNDLKKFDSEQIKEDNFNSVTWNIKS